MTDTLPARSDGRRRIPLSFPQLSEAFVTLRSPELRWLNMYRTFKVATGDIPRIAAAICRLAARNTILRTFYVDDAEPYQVVADSADFNVERIEHAALEGEDHAKRALLDWARSPIDTTRAGHLKIAAAEIGEGLSYLCFSIPHLSWDYRSWSLLLAEIDRQLSPAEGATDEVHDRDYAYENFAIGQRAEGTYAKLIHRHRRFAGSVLNPDRKKGEIGRFLGIAGDVEIPGPLGHVTCQVDALPQGLQGNEQAIALAVIARSVATVFGIGIVPFAAPVDARARRNSHVLGFCVNVLYLNIPVDVASAPSLRDISACRKITHAALRYRTVPLLPDTIDAVDDLPSDVVNFTLQNGYDRARSWDEIPFNFIRESSGRYEWLGDRVNLDSPAGISALYVTALVTDSRFAIDLGYRTDLISGAIAEEIIGLASHFLATYTALLLASLDG